MGAGARPAVPALRRYVAIPPRPPDPFGGKSVVEREMKEADLRRDINEILSRFR
jgi:hypothetical protein